MNLYYFSERGETLITFIEYYEVALVRAAVRSMVIWDF